MSIFDRSFIVPKNETERSLKLPPLSGQDAKLFRGLTQEASQRAAAIKQMQKMIDEKHSYVFHDLHFGGNVTINYYLDSISILNGDDIIAMVAVPLLDQTAYEDSDVMFIPFMMDEMMYYVELGFKYERVKVSGLWKPEADKTDYTCRISQKKMPWAAGAVADAVMYPAKFGSPIPTQYVRHHLDLSEDNTLYWINGTLTVKSGTDFRDEEISTFYTKTSDITNSINCAVMVNSSLMNINIDANHISASFMIFNGNFGKPERESYKITGCNLKAVKVVTLPEA